MVSGLMRDALPGVTKKLLDEMVVVVHNLASVLRQNSAAEQKWWCLR